MTKICPKDKDAYDKHKAAKEFAMRAAISKEDIDDGFEASIAST